MKQDRFEFVIREIFVRSITTELINSFCYEAEESFDYFLNDEKVLSSSLNVNTIDGLCPDTGYTLSVYEHESGELIGKEVFRTSFESVLLNVRSFGAGGDGRTDDTAFIQACINACPKNGTVYLESGTYLSGPVFLKSGINIWIPEGSVILGIPDRSGYPILPGMTYSTDETDEYNLGTWEGNPLDCYASLITGIDVSETDIFGRGVIDANAVSSDWWRDPKKKRGAWRPRTVFLERCRNIRIQGLSVRNSPSWTIHPYYCEDLAFLSLRISNPPDSPNTDGLNPESCRNVLILGLFISVGDDCIAIKSGKYYMALKHHKETENIEIRNCLFKKGHGSVTMGSECAGGIKKVQVKNCIFDGTDRGLRIKTRRGRGKRSVIEDIVFENIRMRGVKMPFTINMFYFCDPDGHSSYCQDKNPVRADDMTPQIASVSVSHVICTGVDICLLCAYGLPEKKIGLISLRDIDASFKQEKDRKPELALMMDDLDRMSGKGIFVRNASRLILENMILRDTDDKEIDAEDVDGIDAHNVEFV
ncbi:MAG: glycoside hydrolase family 28 protein [Lachnospiraceae bacterium]|nr:glycoside hydrolase family 28 protein [Lachnospiraceae bacterium]